MRASQLADVAQDAMGAEIGSTFGDIQQSLGDGLTPAATVSRLPASETAAQPKAPRVRKASPAKPVASKSAPPKKAASRPRKPAGPKA
jgi:hypothetical protein